jgi:hypothetical protein
MDTIKHEETAPKSIFIANPIYDIAFKRLMENERVVKFFLSTALEPQVVDVTVRPQEYTVKREDTDPKTKEIIVYTVFRLDFIATVKTEDNGIKKILIEVQKSKDQDDLMRFRNYLAEQYKKRDEIDGEETVLPIVTIYILGFNLKGINTAFVRVKREYTDGIDNKPIWTKSSFIESLTHDSYVIQTRRITDKRYNTKLDKILSLFEQKHFLRDDSEIIKHYLYQPDNEDISLMTSILHKMVVDPEELRQIEKEEEAYRFIHDLYGRRLEKIDKVIEEKDKAIEEKDKVIVEKDKVIEEKDKALEEERKMRVEQRKELDELKRRYNIE